MDDAGPPGDPTFERYYARCKGLILRPFDEWERIEHEKPVLRDLFLRWVGPFCLFFFLVPQMGAIAFPATINGVKSAPSIATALFAVIVGTPLMAGGVWVTAWIIDRLAPQFDGVRDADQAMKLAAYAGTPLWLTAIFGIVPAISLFMAVGLYAVFVLYAGLPVLMKAKREECIAYTASIVASVLVMAIVAMMLSSCVTFGVRPKPKGPLPTPTIESTPVQKANPNAPIDPEKMRRLLPEAAPGGWIRAGAQFNRGGALGFVGPTMEATYVRPPATMVFRIIDLGPGAAPALIQSYKLLHPPKDNHEGYVRIQEGAGDTLIEEGDPAGVYRRLAVLGQRVALYVEAKGGAGPADTEDLLALVDRRRVLQLAQGL
jgi:hypothetical protein